MSHQALVRKTQQTESRDRTRWGPVHVYRRRSSKVVMDALVVRLAGLGSQVQRGRLMAALALLATAGTVAAIALSALSPSTRPVRQAAAHRAPITRSAVGGAVAQGRNALPSRRAARSASSAQSPELQSSRLSSRRSAQPAPTRVSPAAATRLEANGHGLLSEGHYAAAVPVLQRAVAATGERNGACLEPADHNCLTYAFALYDLGRALRLSGHPAAAVPVLERRLRIDNQRGAVAAELVLAVGGSTG
jgi:hypothetical protein